MEANETRAIFGTGRKALTGKGTVVSDACGAVVEIPHGSMDLVIMNPPFTRPTNHEATEIPVPSFAGFSTKMEEQEKMSTCLKEIRKGLVDPAGLASNFIDLGHIKLQPGGILALVLPATFMQGTSWQNARALLRRCYKDILIVGIAADGNTARAFSADTNMAEILIVATRKKNNGKSSENLFITNIFSRPSTQLEASTTAKVIEQSRKNQTQSAGKLRELYT